MRIARVRLLGRVAVWVLGGTVLMDPVPSAYSGDLASSATELRLAWVDLCRLPPALRQAAEREVRTLLEPVGIRLVARSVAPGLDEPTGGVLVVLLPSDPAHGRNGYRSAGAARREAEHRGTVWVFPPNVARALGLRWEREPIWNPAERRLFARGLGAVVVHELAHVFASAPHRKTGMMSDQLRAQWVGDPRLAVDADLHAAFRDGVAALEGLAPPPGERTASRR
jgi:hypothetical protein